MKKLLELLSKFRTSTKSGAAGLVALALPLVPFYDEINAYILEACKSDQGPTVALASGAVVWLTMYVTARGSKTPANPGVL